MALLSSRSHSIDTRCLTNESGDPKHSAQSAIDSTTKSRSDRSRDTTHASLGRYALYVNIPTNLQVIVLAADIDTLRGVVLDDRFRGARAESHAAANTVLVLLVSDGPDQTVSFSWYRSVSGIATHPS